MFSLREILARHSPVLLIDSASSLIQVGVFGQDRTAVWAQSADEAGVGIFSCAEAALARAGVTLNQIEAFVFCDRPGSVLGIRTAAVAIRAWRALRTRPAFAYGSLDLVAKYQLHSGAVAPFSVIADARRDTWHVVRVETDGGVASMRREKPDTLSGALFTPEHFRRWAEPPVAVRSVPYSLETMLGALPDAPLFRETSEPDAFLHEEPVYQTWTPQVHRAPS